MSKMNDAQALEQYRIALENATNTTTIAEALTEIGYDETVINEGKALLQSAQEAYAANKTEDDEATEAYSNFSAKKEELENIYRTHRKKAKVIFRNDVLSLEKLGIKGIVPKAYVAWFETLKKFYVTANTSDEMKTELSRLAISAEDITSVLSTINELETVRAIYLRERGESQEATQSKDKAIDELRIWMSDFYTVARIALEDQPQLLEALGKVVR